MKQVIRSETTLALVPFRTQVFGPDDIENVKAVQAGYKAQTLSAFLGQPAPQAAPAIDYIKPLSPEAQKTSLEFFNILNFVLQFGPTHHRKALWGLVDSADRFYKYSAPTELNQRGKANLESLPLPNPLLHSEGKRGSKKTPLFVRADSCPFVVEANGLLNAVPSTDTAPPPTRRTRPHT